MDKEPTPPKVPLHFDKPKVIPRISKGVLKFLEHNPNARDTQHYSIVEDLGQTPCVMSALKVLQTFSSHRNDLLTALGMVDSHPSTVIKFETHEVQHLFPYHVDFIVHVECMNNTSKHQVIDKGATTSMMSLT